MTLPPFNPPKPGKHGQILFELAASTMKRKDLLGYLGAILRQSESPTEAEARPLMELVGVPHGDRNKFVRDLVFEAKRQREVWMARHRDMLRLARHTSRTMVYRRLRAFRILFPDREAKRYFTRLLGIKRKKGEDLFVEGHDCRLRPVHVALVLVSHRAASHDLRQYGFLLYRMPQGRLGSVPIFRRPDHAASPAEAAEVPDIPGLIRGLEVDSVVAARAQGCDVDVLWDRQQHRVRHPDGREFITAWRPKLVF